MATNIAKIFYNGRSQAIRLPKEFRFDTDEVFVTKDGENLILSPKPRITWDEYFATAEKFPDFDLERDSVALPQRREFFDD
jgi:antitoxin VapB